MSRNSARFALVLPRSVPTGALVESGFALALDIPSVYFLADENDLPYNLRKAAEVYEHVFTIPYRDRDHLLGMIAKHKWKLFPRASPPPSEPVAADDS